MTDGPAATAAPPPPAASDVFGDRLVLAQAYAAWLADAGVVRGLIGPREAPRLWDRHLLNCAVLTEVLPAGSSVADIGSGAGLPGLALAIARPDLRVTLVEPLLRRATFLQEVVDDLDLGAVEVVRARAEDVRERRFAVTVSRAVAPLPRLADWCLPMTEVGGAMVALKGDRAATEVAELPPASWTASGAAQPEVLTVGVGVVDPPVTVVRVVREREAPVRLVGHDGPPSGRPRRRSSSARRRPR